MASWLKSWFGYGLGAGVAKAIFGDNDPSKQKEPFVIRNQTEEEIRADEKRFAEEEKRLDAQDAIGKKR